MTCPILVVTHRMPECSFESQKQIDHDNSSDRKWLGSHSFWALRNGRKVTTVPWPYASQVGNVETPTIQPFECPACGATYDQTHFRTCPNHVESN